ncbi:hypothetical protein C4544_00710 [candidate division WS5 bacterium]|uniref:ATP-binding protein n=1 Tax=candidate division WS5 bacterium TaxID=2093353 RepID=A0A419DGE0_9BACT|nr:MAG: hypothetical protein C4544_00710 [candidate division WS5 bacterium]
MTLYDHIKIKRRYTRSVNLERDLDIADSVKGYILTPKANDFIQRFCDALTSPNSVRAWTLTGVYGTGKSAFAHFLSALCSAKDDRIRSNAVSILKDSGAHVKGSLKSINDRGLVKAVATSQREPITYTLVRALKNGSERYWEGVRGTKPGILADIEEAYNGVKKKKEIDNKQVMSLIREVSIASKSGLLIIIDELGKNLEYAAQNNSVSDLYILQQIAELPTGGSKPQVFFIGLLHQSFYEYAHGLASTSRSEWAKIQGRFEDIPFSESPDRLFYLIKNAIDYSDSHKLKSSIKNWSAKWETMLRQQDIMSKSSLKELASIYPLHPIAAAALPILCNKFSQNDRTLFTFLSSDEPFSFKTFLSQADIPTEKVTTLKLDQVYDYFIESAGIALSARPHYQRWLEIQGRISDARNLDLDAIKVLKAVGVLNLISNAGALKASRNMVALSLDDVPGDRKSTQYWNSIIDSLIKKGFITWRKQFDELRIWEGSDFDIETALLEQSQITRSSLAELLNKYYPLNPIIPRRHSYETGTVRYFERRYFDSLPASIECSRRDNDGVICYVTSEVKHHTKVPAFTTDNKPVVIITAAETEALRAACFEYASLLNISKSAKQLQSDGVARREVRQRLFDSNQHLEEALSRSFALTMTKCWTTGNKEHIKSERDFNTRISLLCDKVYCKGAHLWNELINRRELTSQGAKARRELIVALINNTDQERLGINGHGPEYSMYESLIRATGIHRVNGDTWYIDRPNKDSGIYEAWKEIEAFCLAATSSPRSITDLYEIIENPPYGIKRGINPVLLMSVLLYHNEYLSIYFDGSYVPVLGVEHFDLLTKRPDKFAVKYFEISGLKAQLFRELEEIVTASIPSNKTVRNATVLSIVNPLIRFIRGLPQYAQRTHTLSNEAQAVRKALLEAKEPDVLLFSDLPQACGYSFIDINSSIDTKHVKDFRKKLILALQEIQTTYENVLNRCSKLIGHAFSVSPEIKELRSYLRAVAARVNSNTHVLELNLKRFINAGINSELDDKVWLEALLMVIADKPVNSWTDHDELVFEVKLGEITRRFKNIESIIELKGEEHEGFDARKITVTFPDGREINEVVWLDHKDREEANKIANEIIGGEFFTNNAKINRALLTTIIERVFGLNEKEEPIAKDQGKKKQYGR